MPEQYVLPWKRPYLIGIAGCSGSGKTSIASTAIEKLNLPWAVLLSTDNFYKPLSEESRKLAFQNLYDFDSPEAFDLDFLVEKLTAIKQGKKVTIPVYSFELHNRTDKSITIYGANIVIIEGIYALYDPRVLELLDLKIFVETDFDICLARRLKRDILYRGRDTEGVIEQWNRFVKPNFIKYVRSTSDCANIIFPRGLSNTAAIDTLVAHTRRRLKEISRQHRAEFLAIPLGDSLSIVEELVATPQVRGIQTILSLKTTGREDFRFFFTRIAYILISKALEKLSYLDMKGETPTGEFYDGKALPYDDLVAVEMIRGGECFYDALKKTIPSIKIGKVLIQSDNRTGEAQLLNLNLPSSMESKKVLLLETEIVSGAGILMAIAILKDFHVKEEDITIVVYSATNIALRRLVQAFPHVSVVVGMTLQTFNRRYIDASYFGT